MRMLAATIFAIAAALIVGTAARALNDSLMAQATAVFEIAHH